MAEDALKNLVGSLEGNGGQVMLVCAQQLAGTKEAQQHQQINAFWMVIIILLRSSMAQEHLCHL